MVQPNLGKTLHPKVSYKYGPETYKIIQPKLGELDPWTGLRGWGHTLGWRWRATLRGEDIVGRSLRCVGAQSLRAVFAFLSSVSDLGRHFWGVGPFSDLGRHFSDFLGGWTVFRGRQRVGVFFL